MAPPPELAMKSCVVPSPSGSARKATRWPLGEHRKMAPPQDPIPQGLSLGEVLGNLLIIAENDTDADGDGRIDIPDDERGRPAGSLFFDFTIPITSFGFDLIDVEGPQEFGSGFVAFFFGGQELDRIGFGDLSGLDPSVVFGDSTANRILPITAASLGIEPFQRVEINLGGSAAVDNIVATPVPEPATWLLLGAGLAALLRLRRRRRG